MTDGCFSAVFRVFCRPTPFFCFYSLHYFYSIFSIIAIRFCSTGPLQKTTFSSTHTPLWTASFCMIQIAGRPTTMGWRTSGGLLDWIESCIAIFHGNERGVAATDRWIVTAGPTCYGFDSGGNRPVGQWRPMATQSFQQLSFYGVIIGF